MKNKSNSLDKIKNKTLLTLKTIGLILLLLIGPSFIILLFGNNYINFSTKTRITIAFIADLIILGILFIIYKDTLIKDFKKYFNKKISENFETSFKYWFIGFLVMLGSNLLISVITDGQIASNEESVRSLIDIAPLYMIFNVSIYAPLTEELIFRKSIKDITNNKWLYIILSGGIFGALHVITSLTGLIDLIYLVPYCSLGITFAALYHKTNNIYSSITMHCMHNTMAIILYLLVLWKNSYIL